jgi:hypothetical protein
MRKGEGRCLIRNRTFTPLESPAACSGDEDIILFRANTGFNAPCEPPRWKVEDFLTGFTLDRGGRTIQTIEDRLSFDSYASHG